MKNYTEYSYDERNWNLKHHIIFLSVKIEINTATINIRGLYRRKFTWRTFDRSNNKEPTKGKLNKWSTKGWTRFVSCEIFPVLRAENIVSSGKFKMPVSPERSSDKFNEPSEEIKCPRSFTIPPRDIPSRSKYYYKHWNISMNIYIRII